MNIEIPALSDFHVHLRQGEMARRVAPYTARTCGRCLLMPNTTPSIANAPVLRAYRRECDPLLQGVDVLYSFKLFYGPEAAANTTPDMVDALHQNDCTAGKLYPSGVTTASHDGVPLDVLCNPEKYTAFADVLAQMERRGMVLSIHGEMPGEEDPLLREAHFLGFVDWTADRFPKLRIVLEHITTRDAVVFVKRAGSNVSATITAHHLLLHLGHVLGSACNDGLGYGDGKLHPHNFCHPVPKRPADREALQTVVLQGDPQFFLGSDSAPHPRDAKEASCGCAGVFSAPVLPAVLAEFFAERDALDQLEGFTSRYGDAFYRRMQTERRIRLEREPWQVPDAYDGVVPFLAGRHLAWRLVS